MKESFMLKIAISIMVMAVVACSQTNTESSVYEKMLKEFKVDSSTPAKAVETWWNFQALESQYLTELCQKQRSASHYEYFKKIASGEVYKAASANQDCQNYTYSEKIMDVKIESDSKATVIANVKVTNTPPKQQFLDESEMFYQKNGEIFKYEMTKENGEWKLQQAYRDMNQNSKYKSDDNWMVLYSHKDYTPVYFSIFRH